VEEALDDAAVGSDVDEPLGHRLAVDTQRDRQILERLGAEVGDLDGDAHAARAEVRRRLGLEVDDGAVGDGGAVGDVDGNQLRAATSGPGRLGGEAVRRQILQ
jgi:hypothetical protein